MSSGLSMLGKLPGEVLCTVSEVEASTGKFKQKSNTMLYFSKGSPWFLENKLKGNMSGSRGPVRRTRQLLVALTLGVIEMERSSLIL